MMDIRAKCFALILAILAVSAHPAELKVVKVSDGDTIEVLDRRDRIRVRLTGIDAPERGQPSGRASRDYLASLIAGTSVRVESSSTDRYGQVLGRVWARPAGCNDCEPTIDVNLAVLSAGMAWWYRHYASQQTDIDRSDYEAAELEAKKAQLGLWSEEEPIPPWDWRRGRRSQESSKTSTTYDGCGQKQYCNQMHSCTEAFHYMNNCGVKRLDGDGDGIPCETICKL